MPEPTPDPLAPALAHEAPGDLAPAIARGLPEGEPRALEASFVRTSGSRREERTISWDGTTLASALATTRPGSSSRSRSSRSGHQEAWDGLWQALEAAGFWGWPERHDGPGEDLAWSLALTWEDGRRACAGHGQPPGLAAVEAALEDLVG